MLSYWEKQSFISFDHVVIGSGIVGLSTALSLRQRFPKNSIAIFERGWLPTGASTRNAGFACIGSLTELISDAKVMPKEKILALTEMRFRGLKMLRERCGDAAMEYRENGSYELLFDGQENTLQQLDNWNELLRPILKGAAFSIRDQQLSEFKFRGVKHLVKNHFEGEIHSGKTISRLIALCREKNIDIKTGIPVTTVQEEKNGVAILVSDEKQNIVFRASNVVICTNAFARQLLPEADVTPGRGQVIITKPISDLPFKGTFHFDEGFYYFREIDGRVLFGGGRNLDFETERSTEMESNVRITEKLQSLLREVILPETPFEFDYQWTGIMAFGSDKSPIVQQVSNHIFAAVRMGGMGVAIGTAVGEKVAALLPA